MIYTIKNHNFLLNSNGNLMLLIRYFDYGNTSVENPTLYYKGDVNCLLVKNKDTQFLIEYVHPDIRRKLPNVDKILVVEVRDSEIIDEYTAKVKIEEIYGKSHY